MADAACDSAETIPTPWSTAEERRAGCEAFCTHMAEGYSIDCFPGASVKTIRAYVKAYPEDFPPDKLERAAREGLLVWERLGLAGVKGELAKFNATAWIFNMKNRAAWRDRIEASGAAETLLSSDAPQPARTVKARPTGEIALSMMALLAKADYETSDEDVNGTEEAGASSEAGKPD